MKSTQTVFSSVLRTLLVSAVVGACAAEATTDQDEEKEAVATVPQPEAAESGCESEDIAAGATCVARASGTIVDEGGAPPEAGSLVTVCGPVCFAGETAADGSFEVSIDHAIALEQYSIIFHGRPEFAGYYFPVPTRVSDGELRLGELRIFKMPAEGPELPEETMTSITLESAGVELTLPAAAKTRFDFEALTLGGAALQFRARAFTGNELEQLVGPDPGFDVAYALSPFEAHAVLSDDESRTRLPLEMSFPNHADWAPGAAVDVLVLGSYLFTDYAAPAQFEAVASAAVSNDGERITVKPPDGVELLTWVALRLTE